MRVYRQSVYVAKGTIMKRFYLFGLSLSFVAVLLIAIPYSSAASNLQVTLNPPPSVEYVITGYADTADVGDQDYVCVICRNTDGTINDVDIINLHYHHQPALHCWNHN